jgi:membrane protease YdiL (CAAX protease family)
MNKVTLWKIVSAVELVIATTVILLDLFIPTLVILAICAISLLARGDGFKALGFKKVERPFRMITIILVLVIVWTLLQLSAIMPVLNHLTGATQDLSTFESLQGNLSALLFFLLATWTLAALGEEIVYRGYLQIRIYDLVGNTKVGIILAIGFSSVLFGIAHLEQGVIGVAVTGLDAVFFSAVKLKFDGNLWAAVLAHGLSNTVGLVAFFFIGPVYGFW